MRWVKYNLCSTTCVPEKAVRRNACSLWSASITNLQFTVLIYYFLRRRLSKSNISTGLGLKGFPRLREFFRQVEAEMVSNSRNEIHQTWGPLCNPSLRVRSALWLISQENRITSRKYHSHLVVSARKNDSMRSSRVWSRTSFTVAYPQSVRAEY